MLTGFRTIKSVFFAIMFLSNFTFIAYRVDFSQLQYVLVRSDAA